MFKFDSDLWFVLKNIFIPAILSSVLAIAAGEAWMFYGGTTNEAYIISLGLGWSCVLGFYFYKFIKECL